MEPTENILWSKLQIVTKQTNCIFGLRHKCVYPERSCSEKIFSRKHLLLLLLLLTEIVFRITVENMFSEKG